MFYVRLVEQLGDHADALEALERHVTRGDIVDDMAAAAAKGIALCNRLYLAYGDSCRVFTWEARTCNGSWRDLATIDLPESRNQILRCGVCSY